MRSQEKHGSFGNLVLILFKKMTLRIMRRVGFMFLLFVFRVLSVFVLSCSRVTMVAQLIFFIHKL